MPLSLFVVGMRSVTRADRSGVRLASGGFALKRGSARVPNLIRMYINWAAVRQGLATDIQRLRRLFRLRLRYLRSKQNPNRRKLNEKSTPITTKNKRNGPDTRGK
jgi:hypothetical protein